MDKYEVLLYIPFLYKSQMETFTKYSYEKNLFIYLFRKNSFLNSENSSLCHLTIGFSFSLFIHLGYR